MAVSERITERVRQLPNRAQAEVLDFVEFLLAKAEREASGGKTPAGEDTLAALGRDPVTSGAPDGSENHDAHLYDGK